MYTDSHWIQLFGCFSGRIKEKCLCSLGSLPITTPAKQPRIWRIPLRIRPEEESCRSWTEAWGRSCRSLYTYGENALVRGRMVC